MHLQTQLHQAIALAALAFLPCSSPAADQAQSQDDARRTHDHGSDDSLKHAYNNALHAVDNFYQLNIPGAITYGVKAYGQYKNSEQMDDLRDKNHALENSMGSMGRERAASGLSVGSEPGMSKSGPEHEGAKLPNTGSGSPFMRIDPTFLRDGESAEIAAKVEKLTGLPREKLFKMAADLHSKNMHRSLLDADFVTSAKKAYREIVSKVPSQEFKDTLEKAENIVSMRPAQEVLAKFRAVDDAAASGKLANQDLAAPAAPDTAAAADTKPAAPEIQTEAAAPSTAEPGATAFAPEGAPPDASKKMRSAESLKLEPVDGYLGDMIKTSSSNGGEQEHSIFQVVSSKIREVSNRQFLEQQPQKAVVQTIAELH